MRARVRAVVGVLWVVTAGCAAETDVGASRAAVQNGTPSDREAVVWVIDTGPVGSSRCSGVVIGDRWVLSPRFCTDGPTVQVTPDEDLGRITTLHRAVRVYPGPSYVTAGGTVAVDLVELEEPLDVTPAELSSAEPAVDDLYVLAGFGDQDSTTSMKTEGAMRITEVTDETFTTIPEGDVAGCRQDHAFFDPDGRVAGFALLGTVHETYSQCLGTITALRTAYFRDFVETTLAAAPDAGTPLPDAAAADSGLPMDDGGTVDSAADAGATTGDGGSGCAVARKDGERSGGPAACFAVALALLFRRNRRAHRAARSGVIRKEEGTRR